MADLAKSDVLIELGVQTQYLDATNGQACTNTEELTRNLKRLMAYARWTKTCVLTCIDANPNLSHNGNGHAARNGNGHASMNGSGASLRQYMPAFALLADHKVVECDNQPCVALDILKDTQQAIFSKEHQDPFTNPKLDRLLTEMPAQRFVVFGLPLDTSLRSLVLGLLRRNRRVALVQDAVGYSNASTAEHVLRQLGVKGCELLTTQELVRSSAARVLRVRYLRERRSVA